MLFVFNPLGLACWWSFSGSELILVDSNSNKNNFIVPIKF
ncbi:hypothetical protein Mgra_00006456, partial [Meloidogyne graminicola]